MIGDCLTRLGALVECYSLLRSAAADLPGLRRKSRTQHAPVANYGGVSDDVRVEATSVCRTKLGVTCAAGMVSAERDKRFGSANRPVCRTDLGITCPARRVGAEPFGDESWKPEIVTIPKLKLNIFTFLIARTRVHLHFRVVL